jgi:hypothetical protein
MSSPAYRVALARWSENGTHDAPARSHKVVKRWGCQPALVARPLPVIAESSCDGRVRRPRPPKLGERRWKLEEQRRKQSRPSWLPWIASLSLSSGAHARDPVARNDAERFARNGVRWSRGWDAKSRRPGTWPSPCPLGVTVTCGRIRLRLRKIGKLTMRLLWAERAASRA